VGSVPDPRDRVVGQDGTGAGAYALGGRIVNVAIVEIMVRECGCAGVHCTRLSARTRRTEGTVDVQERPSDMRAAPEVRTQLGSERPARGAVSGCLHRAELRVHRGVHGRRVVERNELREERQQGRADCARRSRVPSWDRELRNRWRGEHGLDVRKAGRGVQCVVEQIAWGP
jgi:hypothetical protein